MEYTLKIRRDTAARWAQNNPILNDGEPGFETDTGRLKIGTGFTHWNELSHFSPRATNDVPDASSLSEHINSENPHPVYDDGPSLTLLYQNAKV